MCIRDRGILFILSVYRFPAGIVGNLRLSAWRKRTQAAREG